MPADEEMMKLVKRICLILSAFSVSFGFFELTFDLHSRPSTSDTIIPSLISYRDVDVVIFVQGIAYGVLYGGIRKRAVFAWKLGFWLLGWMITMSLIQEFWLITFPHSFLMSTGGWLMSGVATIGLISMFIFAGVWWKRQRGYFSNDGN